MDNFFYILYGIAILVSVIFVFIDTRKRSAESGLQILLPIMCIFLYPLIFIIYLFNRDRVLGPAYGESAFLNNINKNFSYTYYEAGTGYAINMLERKLAIYQNKNIHTYGFSDIRKIGYEKTNNKLTLYITISDIQNPIFNIKFKNENNLLSSYEIFNQALEGTLPIITQTES